MDWIKARIECFPEHAWATLKERLSADLNEWKEHQNEFVRGRTSFHREDKLIIVSRRALIGTQIESFLSVKKNDNGIFFARTPEGEEEKLIPALNAKGECRFSYKGQELEFWQVSRFLLEPVLF